MTSENWFQRLESYFNFDRDSIAGASKHKRGRRRPRNYRQARKARRKMAKASRKRNR